MSYILGQPAQNRLLNVKVNAILSRRILHPDFVSLAKTVQGASFTIFQAQQLRSEILSIPDFQVLEAVRTNPSPEEIETLGAVDAFMGPLTADGFEASWGFHINPGLELFSCGVPQFIQEARKSGFDSGNTLERQILSSYDSVQPISNDPFYCPPEPDIPLPWIVNYPGPGIEAIDGNHMVPRPFNPHARFWRIWLGRPLSENFAYIPNMVEIERVLKVYPFPQPFNRDYSFILARHIVSALRSFARTPAALNDTVIRVSLTMLVLEKYSAMVAELEDYLEEQADNEKRRQITQAIGLAAVGALVGAGLAAAAFSTATSTIATKGLSSIGQFYSKQQQANLSQEIEAASLALQSEDPAFAKEVKFTSDVLRFMAEGSTEGQAVAAAGGGDGIGALEIAGIGAGALVLMYFLGVFE